MKNIIKKSYSPAFKTRVVKEILGQEKTVSQICSEYKIHPTQAHEWRKKAIVQMQEGFNNPLKKDSRAAEQEELISDLYNKIGQLTVELEWLKKKF